MKKITAIRTAAIACTLAAVLLFLTVAGALLLGAGLLLRSPAYEKSDDGTYIGRFTDRTIADAESAILAVRDVADELNLTNAADELSLRRTDRAGGLTYYRLQQNYKGLPVLGGDFVVVSDTNGHAQALAKNADDVDPDLSITPTIAQEDAERTAGTYFGVSTRMELPALREDLLAIYGHTATGVSHLVYDLELTVDGEPTRLLLDAHSGEVLLAYTTTTSATVTATAADHTGQKREDFHVSKITRDGIIFYRLEDEERNIRIINAGGGTLSYEVYDEDNLLLWARNKEVAVPDDYTYRFPTCSVVWYTTAEGGISYPSCTDNRWSDPEVKKGVTLLTNLQTTYDFYNELFDLRGVDGNMPDCLITACYNELMLTDDGQVENNAYSWAFASLDLPETLLSFSTLNDIGLDTVAHEYTHAVERRISSMMYSGESGAIMEGYSDVFGELVEDWARDGKLDGDCDWEHFGRNIAAPALSGQPRVHNGSGYLDPAVHTDDNGAVHHNSTVISHMAYVMTYDRKTGNLLVDHITEQVQGTALDEEELAELWFHTLYMLPENADFVVLRHRMEAVAQARGLSEKKQARISYAFDAAGIHRELYLAPASKLCVLGEDGKAYNDCRVLIEGTKKDGEYYLFSTTLAQENPMDIELPEGRYWVTVTNSRNPEEAYAVRITVSSRYTDRSFLLNTDFADPADTATETVPPNETESSLPFDGPADEGLSFVSNGDGTCYVSAIRSESPNVIIPTRNPAGETVTAIQCLEDAEGAAFTTLTIPRSVTAIHFDTFYRYTALCAIYYEGSIAEWYRVARFNDLSLHADYTLHCLGGDGLESPFDSIWACGRVGYNVDTLLIDGEMLFSEDGLHDQRLLLECDNRIRLSHHAETLSLRGWIGFENVSIVRFGYSIDSEPCVYGRFAVEDPEDLHNIYLSGGELAERYHIHVPLSALSEGEHTVSFVAELSDGSVVLLRAPVEVTVS